MHLRRILASATASLTALVSCAQPEPPADHVFLDGYVYTVDEQRRVAQAVATRGDRIVYVGDSEGARSLVGDETEVHDLDGRMLLPGLHDAHIHPMGIVQRDICDFQSRPMSLEEMVPFLRGCIDRYVIPEGEWLMVPQWNFSVGNQPSARYPTLRAALDSASYQHPILLRGNDGHHAAANSLALANARDRQGNRVGLSKETLASVFADYRELVGVDERGEPNGGLTESAIGLTGAPGFFSTQDPSSIAPAIAEVLAASGITSIQDAATDPEHLPLYDSLHEEGRMTFRLRASLIEGFDGAEKPGLEDIPSLLSRFRRLREEYAKTPYIRADAAKIFVDGVIEGNPVAEPPTLPNAAVIQRYRQPIFDIDFEAHKTEIAGYVDLEGEACQKVRANGEAFGGDEQVASFRSRHGFHPGQCIESRGVLEHDVEFIRTYIAELDRAGFTVHAHAIGDRAVRTAVDAFAHARYVNGATGLPHNIAHAQLIHPNDQKRIGELGLFVTFTHAWSLPGLPYDLSVAPFIDELKEGVAELYSTDNYYMKNVYPAASIQRFGGVVTAGSDAPVDDRDPRPFFNMEQAVTRADDTAEDGVVLNAEERLSIHNIIAAYTINGARAMRQEDRLGSIEVGKKADLIVVDQNLVELAEGGQAQRISDTRVLTTMFDGGIVYRSPG